MIFREATIADISQLQIIRNAVKENRLSNPALITYNDYKNFITQKGKGWICEANNFIVGFCIVDLIDKNIWALFVHPDHEGKSIGKTLHAIMLNWYFQQTKETIWLSTAPNTKAEKFYRKAGWKKVGMHSKEIKFEMSFADWLALTRLL